MYGRGGKAVGFKLSDGIERGGTGSSKVVYMGGEFKVVLKDDS